MKQLAGVACLLLACGTQSGIVVRGNPRLATRHSAQTVEGSPNILYAEWTGKTLVLQGENFADGATVLIDGQPFKSSNGAALPANILYAKKAKKKVAADRVIQLQAQNPDGKISNEFTFYSGFVVTLGFEGSSISLSLGERFLLYLPPEGEPPRVGWSISIIGTDQTILTRTTDNLPIPDAQGFFQAVRPGQVTISAEGSPLCPPAPPQACLSGSHMGFDVGVIVQ